MKNIEGLELTIYSDDGDNFSISLSSTQTLIISKILGFEFQGEEYSMFNDKTLNQIMKMKGNPLNLVNINSVR
ncbi:hypothetical protein [Fusobacterium gastrosuis]|jgi:hypothetical protein|uniref:hypothetical protein n=1 Tax=Fusobacterium gastrosuis TaxID=1755100 RepID=UPI002A8F61B8|nr:hypothetical protein [Lactobacillus johnsonii]MDY5305644.1 hypothetical protein [Fusobacterium gastrosuis]